MDGYPRRRLVRASWGRRLPGRYSGLPGAVVLQRDTPVAETFCMFDRASRRGVVLDRGRVMSIILNLVPRRRSAACKDAARGVDGSVSSPGRAPVTACASGWT